MTRRELLTTAVIVPAFAAICKERDDSAYLQALVDRGITIPSGAYRLSRAIDCRHRTVRGVDSHYELLPGAEAWVIVDRHTNARGLTRNFIRVGQ